MSFWIFLLRPKRCAAKFHAEPRNFRAEINFLGLFREENAFLKYIEGPEKAHDSSMRPQTVSRRSLGGVWEGSGRGLRGVWEGSFRELGHLGPLEGLGA